MYYAKEERYELRYISKKDGKEKSCYPRSTEKKDEQLQLCKERGVKVVYCKKLYPFSTEKNQHNFELVHNVCRNTMHDMDMGDIEYNEAEYDRLAELASKAEELFCLELPVAWLPYEQLKEAKEISQMAILHRQEACIANGRPDLVKYC